MNVLCYVTFSDPDQIPEGKIKIKKNLFWTISLSSADLFEVCVGGGGGFDIYMFVRLQKLQPGALCFRLLVDQLKLHPRYWTGMWSAYLETSDKNPNFCWSCNQYIIYSWCFGPYNRTWSDAIFIPKDLKAWNVGLSNESHFKYVF